MCCRKRKVPERWLIVSNGWRADLRDLRKVRARFRNRYEMKFMMTRCTCQREPRAEYQHEDSP